MHYGLLNSPVLQDELESKKKLSGLMKEQNDDELKKLWQQQPPRNPESGPIGGANDFCYAK